MAGWTGAEMAAWVEAVLRARWLVGGLGESASPAWWRSQALTPAGGRMLERLFPRTAQAARLEAATRAASAEHDEHIGRLGAYHLFRLPSGDEAALRHFSTSPDGHGYFDDLSRLETVEQRLDALAGLARTEAPVVGPGAVLCGSMKNFREGRALARVCGTYSAAFRANSPTYPYLED
jgi:hypothetical protein